MPESLEPRSDDVGGADDPAEAVTEPLFHEVGSSWYWLLAGPASALMMWFIYTRAGLANQWVVPLAFLLLVSGFVALQVKAARIHTSVELTADKLRQGAEIIPVDTIVRIYPDADSDLTTPAEVEKWQSARALGELTGVPRGRTGIGLKLTGGRTAQAWARKHRDLREALTGLVDTPPEKLL